MAATKLQFKYGQYTKQNAIEMSKVAGVVVYSGVTRGIYVDGKEFVSGEGADKDIQNLIDLLGAVKNTETGLYELSNLENVPTDVANDVTSVLNNLIARTIELESFREALRVDPYAQATIVPTEGSVPAENVTDLTIFGIKQGNGAEGANDGKIYHDVDNDLVIKIAGSYNKDTNRLATEHTVNAAVEALKADILGTLDPEQLDKTIDSIKEIQEVLKGGNFVEWTHDVVNPETGETETKVDLVRVEPVKDEEGNVTGYKTEDGTQVVTIDPETGDITYADGYDKLQETQNVQELLDDINNIEKKELVAKIEVAENREENFVTTETETETDLNGLTVTNYTVGVNYGTFKTGHEEVHNEESKAYVNGIATVEDVQKYIEERFTWVTFESSVEEGVELTSGSTITNEPADANVVITLPKDGTMTVENPIGTNKPIVVR